jgi:DNA-binding transcriptional regulator YiaG
MTITTTHPSSRYGVPVVLDDRGEPLDPPAGLRAVRARLGLSQAQLAAVCGVQRLTVAQWEQGRRGVPAAALNVLAGLLTR